MAITTLSAMLILIFMFVVRSLALLASAATRLAANKNVREKQVASYRVFGPSAHF